ncbi:hypothetical protein [Nitrososphaera sp.]|uniref:hypothetical protein n=1 Tax=Nitrososphaera sp. TaxID=1971748 RepID=UPI00307DA877
MKTWMALAGVALVIASWAFYRVNSDWALEWPFNFVVTVSALCILLAGLALIAIGLWSRKTGSGMSA